MRQSVQSITIHGKTLDHIETLQTLIRSHARARKFIIDHHDTVIHPISQDRQQLSTWQNRQQQSLNRFYHVPKNLPAKLDLVVVVVLVVVGAAAAAAAAAVVAVRQVVVVHA
jgi:hypothetical protein